MDVHQKETEDKSIHSNVQQLRFESATFSAACGCKYFVRLNIGDKIEFEYQIKWIHHYFWYDKGKWAFGK